MIWFLDRAAMKDKKLTVGELIEQLRAYPQYYRVVYMSSDRSEPSYANRSQVIQTIRKTHAGNQNISTTSEPVVELKFERD